MQNCKIANHRGSLSFLLLPCHVDDTWLYVDNDNVVNVQFEWVWCPFNFWIATWSVHSVSHSVPLCLTLSLSVCFIRTMLPRICSFVSYEACLPVQCSTPIRESSRWSTTRRSSAVWRLKNFCCPSIAHSTSIDGLLRSEWRMINITNRWANW